jgi:small subunit ribosomal protein S17
VPEKKTTKRAATRSTKSAAAPRGRSTRATATPAAARVTRRRAAPAKAPKPSAAAAVRAAPAAPPSRRRALIGVVVADKTPQTVVVEVARLRQHPLYKKVIHVRKRIPTHDAREDAKLGDIVRIEESRPFSATKTFRLAEVLSRAGEAREAAPEVAAVASALEAAEGVVEVLPRREEEEEREEERDATP